MDFHHYTPNHGGLLEQLLKALNTICFALLKVTRLTKIEGILNLRSLCTILSVPNNLAPVAPSHFLIGIPLA
nr:unnamed protein product [Callosobruchus analis]